ncbi:hypothetical protein ABPG72_008148 [Tetrahymena utriculariae]
MGGGNTKQKKLTQYELTEFTNQTNLTYSQVENLYTFYKNISASQKDDGVIDMQEFSNSLYLTNQEFSEQVFNVFDLNKDKVINFREFILGLANLINEKVEYKTRFVFNLICKSKTNIVSDKQIYDYMKNLINQFPGVFIEDQVLFAMISEQVKKIVSEYKPEEEEEKNQQNEDIQQNIEEIPSEVNQKKNQSLISIQKNEDEVIKYNELTYSQFKQFVIQNPNTLKWLQIDKNNIALGANKLLGKK